MTALRADKQILRQEGNELDFPVAASQTIYAGALVCVNANGYALPGADTANLIFQGIALEQKDNSSGSNGDLDVVLQRRGLIKVILDTAISQANVGDNVFLVDDQTVDLTANVDNNIFCGIIAQYIDSTHAYIDIEPAIRQADVATHIADSSAAHAASAISVADSGSIVTATEVEAAIQEIMTGIKTAQYTLFPQALRLETGAAIGAFADGSTDGWAQVSNKDLALKWNTGANPTDMVAVFIMPQDLDDSEDIIVHLLGAIVKAGGDEADSPKVTVEAYFSTAGANPAADADAGDDSSEFVTGDDAAWQEETLTIAAADVPASPSVLTLVFHPKDGELGTDDFLLMPPWLEVTRKCLTS